MYLFEVMIETAERYEFIDINNMVAFIDTLDGAKVRATPTEQEFVVILIKCNSIQVDVCYEIADAFTKYVIERMKVALQKDVLGMELKVRSDIFDILTRGNFMFMNTI